MEKNRYKCFQGTVKLWCLTKWSNCRVLCAKEPSDEVADVVAKTGNQRIGFVFVLDKPTDSIKTQIRNCRRFCDKIFLITNEIDLENIPKFEQDLSVLNIADRFGFGNVLEQV